MKIVYLNNHKKELWIIMSLQVVADSLTPTCSIMLSRKL
jgi:hypothetical protein